MLKGICFICSKNKATFIGCTAKGLTSSATGSTSSAAGLTSSVGRGFSLNSFVNNLPIELHQFAEKEENVPGGSFNKLISKNILTVVLGQKYEQHVTEWYQ